MLSGAAVHHGPRKSPSGKLRASPRRPFWAFTTARQIKSGDYTANCSDRAFKDSHKVGPLAYSGSVTVTAPELTQPGKRDVPRFSASAGPNTIESRAEFESGIPRSAGS